MSWGDLPRRPDGTVILRDYEKEEKERQQRQRELDEAAAREIAHAEAAITAIAPLPDPRRGTDGRFRPATAAIRQDGRLVQSGNRRRISSSTASPRRRPM